jgi:hypothetical protein
MVESRADRRIADLAPLLTAAAVADGEIFSDDATECAVTGFETQMRLAVRLSDDAG